MAAHPQSRGPGPDRRSTLPTMCILCPLRTVAARGARQLLSNWAGAPCALQQRAYSSLPEPAVAGGSHANAKDGFVAHPDLLNDNLLKAQYAVRGELYNKALELQKQGRELIFTNGAGQAAVPGSSGASVSSAAVRQTRVRDLHAAACPASPPARSRQPAAAGPAAHHLQPPGAPPTR